jgi:TRAP-type C4-dicarboxylate transport system permease small subunit
VAPLAARLKRGAELASAAMFAAMLGAFIIQVASRYVFDAPVAWTIEVCSITYIWIVFFASATILTPRQHITFDMLYGHVGPKTRRVFAIVTTATILAVFLAGLPGTLEYVQFVGRKFTLIMHIRLDLLYSCFAIFMVGAILGAAFRLRRLLGRDWKSGL